jgi:hypothetical protein
MAWTNESPVLLVRLEKKPSPTKENQNVPTRQTMTSQTNRIYVMDETMPKKACVELIKPLTERISKPIT